MGNALFFSYCMGILQYLSAIQIVGNNDLATANYLIKQRRELLQSEHNEVTIDYRIEFNEENRQFQLTKPNNDGTTKKTIEG